MNPILLSLFSERFLLLFLIVAMNFSLPTTNILLSRCIISSLPLPRLVFAPIFGRPSNQPFPKFRYSPSVDSLQVPIALSLWQMLLQSSHPPPELRTSFLAFSSVFACKVSQYYTRVSVALSWSCNPLARPSASKAFDSAYSPVASLVTASYMAFA